MGKIIGEHNCPDRIDGSGEWWSGVTISDVVKWYRHLGIARLKDGRIVKKYNVSLDKDIFREIIFAS